MKRFVTPVLLFATMCCTAQKSPCDSATAKTSGIFPADTTIILENGTSVTFNRCDFFEVRNCISLKEIRSAEDARAAGLTTMDNQGNVLLSCGMFVLDMASGGCSIQCLNNPIKIKIPVLQNACAAATGARVLYISNPLGRWQQSQIVSTIKKDANGKEYFEFETKCAGSFNCDQKMQTFRVKFKAGNAKTLEKIEVAAKCPVMNASFTTKKNRNTIVIAKLPCISPDSLHITATLVDKNGSTVTISKPLSQLKTTFKKSACIRKGGKAVRNILGIFKLWQRDIYGKYIVE